MYIYTYVLHKFLTKMLNIHTKSVAVLTFDGRMNIWDTKAKNQHT